MYQRQCITTDKPIIINFDKEIKESVEENLAEISEDTEDEPTLSELEDQYDESSDESELDESDFQEYQAEIGSSTTFLLGMTTRFGRAVRFNNRFLC